MINGAEVLERLQAILSVTYKPEGVRMWINSRNRNLDMQRPIDLIRAGKYAEVLQAAEAIEGGH